MIIALLILFGVAMLVSSVGWKKFVYFLSIGYGYSVAACAIAMIAMYYRTATIDQMFLCIILIAYGCRLGTFVMMREIKSASYRKNLPELTKTSRPMTPGIKIAIWVSVAILYVLEVCPVTFRMGNLAEGMEMSSLFGYIGFGIMAFALFIESLADAQKSAAKKINPDRFCDKGLYRIVRCPNYFGEVLFWTGCFVSGIGAYNSAWQWISAALGYLSIVYIMFGGSRRLELRQNKTYGNDPEYQAYVKKTPIILPLIPIYSVAKYEWLKG